MHYQVKGGVSHNSTIIWKLKQVTTRYHVIVMFLMHVNPGPATFDGHVICYFVTLAQLQYGGS